LPPTDGTRSRRFGRHRARHPALIVAARRTGHTPGGPMQSQAATILTTSDGHRRGSQRSCTQQRPGQFCAPNEVFSGRRRPLGAATKSGRVVSSPRTAGRPVSHGAHGVHRAHGQERTSVLSERCPHHAGNVFRTMCCVAVWSGEVARRPIATSSLLRQAETSSLLRQAE
jgi:hypothetical protein